MSYLEKINAEEKWIIFDCDGVLADWTSYLLKQLYVKLTIDDCYDFSLRTVLRETLGPDVAKRADAICSMNWFTASQPVLPHAKEMVSAARECGNVLIVTSPWATRGWYDERVKWLKKNLGIKQDEVIVGRMKFQVQADLFVDDKPLNVIEWATKNKSSKAVLFAQPYNEKHDPLPENARRLDALGVIDLIKSGLVW